MPATPIERLSCALRAIPARQRPAIGKFAGVPPGALARALAGQQVNPNVYLRLCCAIGIDTITGEAIEPRQIGDIDWDLLALGVRVTLRLRGLRTVRAASKAIGEHASHATLNRLDNAKPISVNGIIAICKFIGTKPDHYCSAPKMLHVKQQSETRQGRAA